MKTQLRSVTRSRPCLICGGDHKCAYGEDGLMLCGRRSEPQPGFVHLGPATKDPQWHLYRVVSCRLSVAREAVGTSPISDNRQLTTDNRQLTTVTVDWVKRADDFRRNLTSALQDELCSLIGLPRLALDALPDIGYDPATQSWTFPECDASGKIIGIVRRNRDGEKKAMPGSRRGLTIPYRWLERGTDLFIVEGQSDALALSLCGVSCIGRPSNCGGAEMLAELLTDFPPDRSITVMGENDQKPDGQWPGKEGAVRVALALTERLQRHIFWALPPDGAKDIRAWILSQNLKPSILDEWHLLGEQLWEK